MDNIRSMNFELEAWVCPAGYDVIATKPRSGGGGIVSLVAAGSVLIHTVVAKEPEILEKRTIKDLSPLWKELVILENVRRVGRRSKIHGVIKRYCGKYGMPSIGLINFEIPVTDVFVADIISQARRMTLAIKNAGSEGVEIPADVLKVFKRDVTFRKSETAGDMYFIFNSTLVAAWFGLIWCRVPPNRVCEFCQGINVARAKARFCSAYCRDRFHKKRLRECLK